ncbi:MAG: NAD(P)/FAD-dependent oxidoreductase [Planctomycetes bacterium]|nr:NAD(P)/FAD-dependent oxidoreductase [Planctomycetota bacterium]
MRIVIVGNGIAGVSAARRIRERQPDWTITLISGESTHHYSRPALMYIFMGHQRYPDTKPYEDHYWTEQRIDLVRDWVVGIDAEQRKVKLHRGGSIAYDRLLLATGSKSNRFGWPGQDLEGVQGLWDLMDLSSLYRTVERTRRAVLVGGGLIGIELAEMLHSRGIPVTFLVREGSYWSSVLPREESAMVTRAIREAHIDLRLGTELASIIDDGQGRVAGVTTADGERIDCELVGLTAGVSPNVDLAKANGVPVGRGILTDRGLRTQVDGIFAAGDCAEIVTGEPRNLIQQVWYTGKAQGRVAGENIAGGDAIYEPGIWYNSAKFLHLEYQTYGWVPATADASNSLWWESADGKRGVRILHDGGRVTGFNLMGIRYRHEVCERWIRERRSLDEVLSHLSEANFDPEFYRRHEASITRQFQEQLR